MGSSPRSARVPARRHVVPGILVLYSSVTALAEVRPRHSRPPETVARVVGDSYRLSGSWFQFLGTTPDGRELWLYPHVDGVYEVFEETASDRWEGDLETVFDPASGTWTNLFNAAEVLNELLDTERRKEHRRRAARLLRFFIELHGADDPPFYLRRKLRTIDRLSAGEPRDWLRPRLARRREIVSRVRLLGTRVKGLEVPGAPGVREYYRRMVADGYLDIAIVGGNLRNNRTGRYQAWSNAQELRGVLEAMGFEPGRFRSADDHVRSTKAVSLLRQPLTARVLVTGGSRKPRRIRRAVANFIEGLAHADVVIFHGHSNRASGAYYASETLASYSKFRIGLGHQDDLHRKFHGLKRKTYQIVAFQSCSSYDKYCRSVGRFFARELHDRPGTAGFMGLSDAGYFDDFVPRYSVFLEMLLEARGPTDMLARLNGIRPTDKSPPFVMRGVLQARYTFIVPAGVDIRDVEELTARSANLVRGTGSDGQIYYSSEVFTQNEPGQIVQVIPFTRGVFGLRRDGRLFVVGRRSDGAMQESYLTKDLGMRFRFAAYLNYTSGDRRLCLVEEDGEIHVVRRSPPGVLRSRRQAPPGVTFVAVGNDATSRFVAEDAEGRFHVWSARKRKYELGDPKLELENVTPSLLGHGVKGTIWKPSS